jgi:hypothetical protein
MLWKHNNVSQDRKTEIKGKKWFKDRKDIEQTLLTKIDAHSYTAILGEPETKEIQAKAFNWHSRTHQSFTAGLLQYIFRSAHALCGWEEGVDKQRQNGMCHHWWRQDHYHIRGVYWIVPLELLGQVVREQASEMDRCA